MLPFSPSLINNLPRFLSKIQAAAGVRGLVELKFVSNAEMHLLNRKFRGRARVTNVLSFPSTLSRAEALGLSSDEPLGLIVLCPETVCRRFHGESRIALREQFKRLLVHGFAHLMHHDHYTLHDHQLMRRYEQKLMFKISAKQLE